MGCALATGEFAEPEPDPFFFASDPFFFAPEPFFLDITAPFERATLRRSIDQE
jgi:hypothetical protein